MKALSLTQPWATLMAAGLKRIETRSWGTKYRGRIAIHAAKGFPVYARELCGRHPFLDALHGLGISSRDFPFGALIATAYLTEIYRMGPNFPFPQEPELSFGDYSPRRYAWFFIDIKKIDPIPYKGQLGLFEVDL
ncbi:hypothetical protein LCGC14_0481110 [marine sediment metagenome]|uniref:ASCH domain-containing protein n=1 Tax=marine sediment metagenome TaxID=412755 RepID=A0A0F9SSJ8_9ZZZZ